MTKTFTRDQIDAMLRTNDAAVERAIIRLFTMQNEDEQQWATTNTQNGRGFGAADARAGTRFARWLQGMDNKNVVRYAKKSLNHPRAERIFGRYTQDGGTVMDRARKIALKHSQQLVDYANGASRNAALHAAAAASGVTQTIHLPENPTDRSEPPAGSYAATARMMARGDNSGFDWDRWKEEMKMMR